MDDSIFITFCQIWSGADYIFRIIVTDLLQRTELPFTCSVFCYYVTCLDIDGLSCLCADEVHLPCIQYSHLYVISQKRQLLINNILNHLLDIRIHTAACLEVTQPKVIPVYFLIGLEYLLSVNVRTAYNSDKECLRLERPVEQDQIG